MTVKAKSLVETAHLSGVIGIKFFGTSSGGTGIGGSAMVLMENNVVTARIADSAQVYAEGLIVLADLRTFTVVIAESGGAADSVAINGSFAYVTIDNITNALVDDGALITVYQTNLEIAKDYKCLFSTEDSLFQIPDYAVYIEEIPLILDSDGDGDVDTDDENIISVDPGADPDDPKDDIYITNLSTLIGAEDESQLFTITGGIVKGKSVGIGVSASVNEVNRNTQVIVGQPVFQADEAVDDDVIDLGYAHNYETGDAVIYYNGGGDSIDGLTNGHTYYVIDDGTTTIKLATSYDNAIDDVAISDLDGSDASGSSHFFVAAGETVGSGEISGSGETKLIAKNDGLIAAGSIAAAIISKQTTGATLSGAEASNDGGKYGVGLSGSGTINTIEDITQAIISYVTLSLEDLDIDAINLSTIVGVSGAVALNFTSQGSTSFGLAGAFAVNELDLITKAIINQSDLLCNDLNMDALNDADIVGAAASLTGVANGPGLAGSVTVNQINDVATAFILNQSDVNADGSANISAHDNSQIVAVAGAVAYGGKALGLGASVAVDLIDSQIQSGIMDSDISTGDTLLLNAISNPNIVSVAVAVAIAKGEMAPAISAAVSMIDNEIGTVISGQKADGIVSTGDVHLTASNDPDITAVAGSVGVSTKGLGVGLSVAYNEIDDTVSASVYGTDIYVINGNLILDAEQKSVIISIAAGGGFANKAAGAGSASTNTIYTTTSAFIDGTVDITADGSVIVSAADEVDITTIAGGVAIAQNGAIGLATSIVITDSTTEAYLGSNVHVNALGNQGPVAVNSGDRDEDGNLETVNFKGVGVLAVSFEDILSVAAGGAGAESLAAGGSVVVTTLDETTRATIGAGAVINAVNVYTSGFDASSAVDESDDSIDLGSGQVFHTGDAVVYHSGGAEDIGLTDGATYYIIVDPLDATTIYLADTRAHALSGTGILDLSSASASQMDSFSYLIGSSQGVLVFASDDTDLDIGAGGLGIAIEGLGLGAGVDVTVINKDTEAYIDTGAVVRAAPKT